MQRSSAWLEVLVAAVATGVILLASTAMAVLSALADSDIAIEPLVVGDLRQLFASHAFWAAFPQLPHLELLWRPGPLLTTGLAAVAAGRALRRRSSAVTAAAVLACGVLPYAVGAVALRGNTVPDATGPWLLWMLLGPLAAAVLALASLLWRRRPARAANSPAPETTVLV